MEETNRRERIVEEKESSDINGYRGRQGEGMPFKVHKK